MLEFGTISLCTKLANPWHSFLSDEVVVEIYSLGTNFRDILVAMGQVEETDKGFKSNSSLRWTTADSIRWTKAEDRIQPKMQH